MKSSLKQNNIKNERKDPIFWQKEKQQQKYNIINILTYIELTI